MSHTTLSPDLNERAQQMAERARDVHGQRVRDLAWAFERRLREDYGDPEGGSLGRLLRAVVLAREVDLDTTPDLAIRAHRALAGAICGDIRRTGFTDSDAPVLLYALYSYLDEGCQMWHERGGWVAREEPFAAAAAPDHGEG